MNTAPSRTSGGRFGRGPAQAAEARTTAAAAAAPAVVRPETAGTPPPRNTLAGIITYERPAGAQRTVRLLRADHSGGVAVSGQHWNALVWAATQHGWQPAGARPLQAPLDAAGAVLWGARPTPGAPVRLPDGRADLDGYSQPRCRILADDAAALARGITAALAPDHSAAATVPASPFTAAGEPVLPLLSAGLDLDIA